MRRAFALMKSRWGVGPYGLVGILGAFSVAGFSTVYLGRPIMDHLLPADMATWLRVVAYLIIVFPLYQVLLLASGALFGQFRFFWDKKKHLLRLLQRVAPRRSTR